MTNCEYSNREIDLMFEKLAENHKAFDEKLDKILEQTTKTNGRVTRLENWKAWLTGAIGVMLPIVTFIAYQILKISTV